MKSFDKLCWKTRERALAPARGLWGKINRYLANKTSIHFQSLKGCFLPLSARFEAPPVFPHGLNGIFVSGGARIGKHCIIFQQVTIGSNTLAGSKRFGSPHIGDGVYIGAGAKIIGAVSVGQGARIGANAVVTRDVAPFATVIGVNEVIPGQPDRDNRYITRTSDGWVAMDSDGSHPVELTYRG